MATSQSTTSTSTGNIADSANNNSATDEFEAILNQLTALGSEIDQELSHSSSKRSSVPVESTNSQQNSGPSSNNVSTMRLKNAVSSALMPPPPPQPPMGSPSQTDYFNHHAPHIVGVHHFSHHYHSQSLGKLYFGNCYF